MGFRFTRRINVVPGLRCNLSKSGVSVGIGGRGHWFTVGPRGTRTTFGLPGTGLYYTTTKLASGEGSGILWLVVLLILGFIVINGLTH